MSRAKPTRREWIRGRVRGWSLLLVVGIGLASFASLFARFHWVADLCTHFVPCYALGALVAAALLSLVRAWKSAAVACILLAVHTWLLLPYMPWPAGPANEEGTVRIMCANVLTQNRQFERFIAAVREVNPDVLAVQEVNREWVKRLAVLEADYPVQKLAPREDNFGVALYSRLAMDELEVAYLQPFDLETIRGTFDLGGTPTTLHVVHLLPPVRAANAKARNSQLQDIATKVAGNGATVVAGDLNTAMWSPHYRDFLERSGLRNARLGQGLCNTWPAEFHPVALPIDHCLVSHDLEVVSCGLGPRTGSDHLSLVVDLRLRDRPDQPDQPDRPDRAER